MRFPTSVALALALAHSVAAKWKYAQCTPEQEKGLDVWMEETLYIMGRGGMALRDMIAEKRKGTIDKSWQGILDAILGEDKTADDYEAVSGEYFKEK
jgi:hypothetical protein